MKDRVALISGASRGIGQACALELGKRGAIVIATTTSERSCQETRTWMQEQGLRGDARLLNVADLEQAPKLIKDIEAEFGPVQIVVNNAGITKDSLMMNMREEDWLEVLQVNLTGSWSLTKACLRGMIKARWGRIINISSVVALAGNPGQTNYTASKAGMLGLTRSLALEVASRNITVNAVAPGFIDTAMTHKLNQEQVTRIKAQIPMQRMGDASDIANAVSFLASEQANYITGATLNVNGGMYM